MGDDGGCGGSSGGGFGDSSGGGFGDSSGGGFGDSSGADNGFCGADNGKSSDDRYNDDNMQPSGDSSDHHWNRSDSTYIDGIAAGDMLAGTNTGRGSSNQAAGVMGSEEDKPKLNGDALMSPMMVDDRDSGFAYGQDDSSNRNGCEDCFWTTVVCCDCTIL